VKHVAVLAAFFTLSLPAAARAQAAGADQPKQPTAAPQAAPKQPAQKSPAAAPAAKKAADPKTLRAVGLAIARSLEVFELTPKELDTVIGGIRDGASGKAKLDESQQAAVNELARTRMEARNQKLAGPEKEKGAAYLAAAEKEKGAQKTASGLVYIPIKEGTGPSPAATDKVKVNYKGTLVDGKEFDSSYARGQPAEFPLNGVIPCWTEGLQKMKVGGKAKLVCPPSIAYGDRGAGGAVPPGATLTFEVELLEIVK
jgi:FKBP-type peptidyl-prolyl cis-trans isomerase